jgi:hypothetical protein
MAKTNSTKITTAVRVAQSSMTKLEAPCNVLSLVPNTVSEVTVGELRILSREAYAGELVGIAYVAIYRGRNYSVHCSGEASRNPTYTRGAIRALDDFVSKKVIRL